VSTFVAEFLRRKDAEIARATAPAKKSSKNKSKGSTGGGSAAQPQQPASAGRPADANGIARSSNAAGSDWAQVPTATKKAAQSKAGSAGSKPAAGAKKGGFSVLKPA
jgi:hypothetical protein